MNELVQALGLVAAGGVTGGSIVAYILRHQLQRWLAAIERVASPEEIAEAKAARAAQTVRIDAQGDRVQEHTFEIRALQGRSENQLTVSEDEHERLSKHIVEITGDFDVLRSRVLVLEIRMEQREKGDKAREEPKHG